MVAADQLHQMNGMEPPTEEKSWVIASDSEYVVKGMMEWLPAWKVCIRFIPFSYCPKCDHCNRDSFLIPVRVKNNKLRNSRTLKPANLDLFSQLDAALPNEEMKGVKIGFWYVPREFNRMADALAKQAAQLGDLEWTKSHKRCSVLRPPRMRWLIIGGAQFETLDDIPEQSSGDQSLLGWFLFSTLIHSWHSSLASEVWMVWNIGCNAVPNINVESIVCSKKRHILAALLEINWRREWRAGCRRAFLNNVLPSSLTNWKPYHKPTFHCVPVNLRLITLLPSPISPKYRHILSTTRFVHRLISQ